MWDPGQKPQNGKTKFLNLLILEHLENYFIEPLNKLLIRCEINGLKNLFVAFAPHPPIYTYYSNSSKTIFIVKTP